MQLLMSLIQASLKRTEIDLIDETQDQTVEELSTKNADHLLKELNDKINSLKRENKSLRESAWREQKKAALLEEKIKAQNSAFEDDRNELARLREILFSMERKDEERPNSQISLPYENKTKIVICGGHDTFIKQIKTLLTGDVRYLNNGYLTQIGLHHDNMFNEFNLSCDFMEPFRPYIDYVVLGLEHNGLTKEIKHSLVGILNRKVIIEKREQYFTNALAIYVKSVFDAIEKMNSALIKYPDYELSVYESNSDV